MGKVYECYKYYYNFSQWVIYQRFLALVSKNLICRKLNDAEIKKASQCGLPLYPKSGYK